MAKRLFIKNIKISNNDVVNKCVESSIAWKRMK